MLVVEITTRSRATAAACAPDRLNFVLGGREKANYARYAHGSMYTYAYKLQDELLQARDWPAWNRDG